MIGGGSIPGGTLPTRLVSIDCRGKAQKLADELRNGSPSVIGRIEENNLILDPRTVLPEEDEQLTKRLTSVLKQR
jgi:L-seryl-tRNA(Ser) seleniumtransferase